MPSLVYFFRYIKKSSFYDHQTLRLNNVQTSTSYSPNLESNNSFYNISQQIRRIRYKGKYPKKFTEKYKELNGDIAVVDKVKEKGMTPAGMHIPVMLDNCLDYLGLNNLDNDKPPFVTVDCTLGYGGHTLEIIKKILPKNGIHIAIDQDEDELKKTELRLRNYINNSISNDGNRERALSSLKIFNLNFRHLSDKLKEENYLGKVTSLLADLGCSSMQIDNPDRGFSYKFDGPLDMRMNIDGNSGVTAKVLLCNSNESALSHLLMENSDEIFSEEIAHSILSNIPNSTLQLANCVKNAYTKAHSKRKLPYPSKSELNSALARTMQALRIEVNDEFQALEELLKSLPAILAPGGRVVFLTFHSGEDRRVKKYLKSGFNNGIFSSWGRDVIVADSNERRSNPRSKCAKLRWAVRT